MTRLSRASFSVLLAGLVACGDGLVMVDTIEATSGSRLKLHKYLFTDGTRQVEPSSFYDTQLHTRCSAKPFADGTTRCVPEADSTVFIDAECTTSAGASDTPDPLRPPTHFIGYDPTENGVVAARLFRAEARMPAPVPYWINDGGQCHGPFAPVAAEYYSVTELDASELAEVSLVERGDGRLAILVLQSEDGLQVITDVRDRELGVSCRATVREDGIACEPVQARDANGFFQDPSCQVHALPDTPEYASTSPQLAHVRQANGCKTYAHATQRIVSTLYRLEGSTCVNAGFGGVSLGPAIALPQLVQQDGIAGSRLHRMILGDEDVRFASEQLWDSATRSECVRTMYEGAWRCLPSPLAATTMLSTAGCQLGNYTLVAVLPERTCQPVQFAVDDSFEVGSIRAIGARLVEPMYSLEDCTLYQPPPGHAIFALGPPIDPALFPTSLEYGER